MRLTSRDETIITRCFEDKLLSSSDLLMIFFKTRQRCNKRLQKLYSQHYLDRHYLSTPLSYHGSFDALYSLGKRGVAVVALKKCLHKEQVQRARQKFAQQLKSYSVLFTLSHIQTNAKIRLAVEKAFEHCQSAELLNWIPERLLEQRFSDDSKRLKLRPDGFMQYKIRASGKLYSAFIETDLGTQSKKQLKDKVRRYLAFSETELPQKEFSTRWFRVLVMAKSERRSQEIKSAIEAVTNKIFWITESDKMSGDSWIDKPIFLRVGMPGRFSLITQEWIPILDKKKVEQTCLTAGRKEIKKWRL